MLFGETPIIVNNVLIKQNIRFQFYLSFDVDLTRIKTNLQIDKIDFQRF